MRRVAFYTLGCKLNQYETDALAAAFRRRGYEVVDFDGEAEAYVINTCTVTNKADRKSRNIINRAKRAGASSGPLVVVTGCYTESHRDRLEAEAAIRVVDNDGKSRIDDIVDAYLSGEIGSGTVETGESGSNGDRRESIGAANLSRFSYQIPERIFHTRGMLKVQDGCDNFCTFCIIPRVRGRATSRPADAVLEEARMLLDTGYRELVFTGVNMSRYRYEDLSFAGLIRSILDLAGDFRVRISSLEPDRLDEEFIDILGHPKMCPHLHLCVQSGSERILLAMRRQYTVAGYRRLVERIRSLHPGYNFTTDVIVGFPGETDEEFAQTADLVREIGFSHVHTFPYSTRSGTKAARMTDQIPEAVKSARSAGIREIAEAYKRRYRESLIGRTERLLVERVQPRYDSTQHPAGDCETRVGSAARGELVLASGYGEHYVPIVVAGAGIEKNEFVPVRVSSVEDGDDPALVGEILA